MTWTNEYWLLGLWLLPLLGFLFYWSGHRSRLQLNRFFDPEMEQILTPRKSRTLSIIRVLLFLTGLGFFFVAAAGPRGSSSVETVQRNGADILVLLDVSRSMLSEDRTPNRLESAKLDIEDILTRVIGDRIGLIVFAGKPAMAVPLTSDYAFFRETLKKVDVRSAPKGGTAIGDAIRLALRSMNRDPSRDHAVILITDGEDHDSMPEEAAANAAEQGVRIFTVALGDSKEGGRIPLYDNSGKRTGYQKEDGKEIWTKADRELLTQIAEKTGGTFLDAGTTPVDLGTFFKKETANLKRSSYGDTEERVWQEEYQTYLFIGIVLILISGFVSPFKSPKKLLPLCLAGILFAATAADADFPTPPGQQIPDDDIYSQNLDFFQPAAQTEETEEGLPQDLFTNSKSDESPSDSNAGEQSTPLPQETSSSTEMTAKQLYNTACRHLASGDDIKAETCLKEALEKCPEKEKNLRAKICYNLGFLGVKELQKKTDSPDQSTSAKPEKPETSIFPGSGNAGKKEEDAVAAYRAGAETRNNQWNEISQSAEKSAVLFQEAETGTEKVLRQNAKKNIDLLRYWLQTQKAQNAAKERQIRNESFQPREHLQWLEEELERVTESETLIHIEDTQKSFQERSLLAKELRERCTDINTLLDEGTFNIRDPQEDQEKILRRKDVLEDSVNQIHKGAEAILEHPADSLLSLRNSLSSIDEAKVTLGNYPETAEESLRIQEETLKQTEEWTGAAETEADTESNNAAAALKIIWRNGYISRRIDQMTAEAQKEFKTHPLTDEEINQGETASDEAEENSLKEESQEVKVRRSMKLALDLGPKIKNEIKKMEDSSQEILKKEVTDREKTILEILKKILEPLQDQQNQDQQNQDQQNQDQQNQDQQNQDQQNQDQQNQDQQNQDQQNQDQQNQDQQNLSQEELKKQQKKENAEGIMRRVRARQQSVEELRKQREALFQRYDKPEKDW